jgi:hypothetical protein
MTPERQQLINQIFEEALELEGARRELYLAGVDDAEVRAEVDRLIAADQKNAKAPLDPELIKYQALLPPGRYRLLSLLGKGGYGVVYLAKDLRLNRLVAIKFLSAISGLSPDLRQRFNQEAVASAAVSHPNVVTVHDVDADGPVPFIVSEYVDGHVLKVLLTPDEAVRIAREIAAALIAAHKAGVIHRDIKPGNVMLTANGSVKVLDFGIAKFIKSDENADLEAPTQVLTTEGQKFGTQPYASPEQLLGRELDHRTDLWSLGVVLFEMLSGKRPFSVDAINQIHEINNGPPAFPSMTPPAHPKLVAILNRALAPKIQDRYRNAEEFRADLDEVFAGELQHVQVEPFRGESLKIIPPAEFIVPFLDDETHLGPIAPVPAVSLSRIEQFKDLPMDLGTTWGLDRSSFIGVLAGLKEDCVFNAMQRVERLLIDLLKTRPQQRLPIRWWLKASPNLLPNGPNTLDDIRSSFTGDVEAFRRLSTGLVSGDLIPGFFFQLNTSESDDQWIATLNWVRGLFAMKAELPQPAVVIHATGESVETATRKAESLILKLNELNLRVPPELVVLRRRPVYMQLKSGAVLNPLNNIGRPLGFHFCSWVSSALQNAGDEWSELQEREYEAVITAVKRYRSAAAPEDLQISSSRQVLSDLERIAAQMASADENEQFFDQFLLLIQRYLPDRTPSLLRELAKSNSRVAVRGSLVFASTSDTLVDAWVDGYFEDRKHKLELHDFKPRNGRPFIDDFVLGLLRRYVRGQNRDQIEAEVNDLSRIFTPDLLQTCSLCFAKLQINEFLKSFGPRKLVNVLRAELDVALQGVDLSKIRLATTELWWLQQGLHPNAGRLREWLQLDSQRRAVFGLCNVTEWQELKKQNDLAEAVTICRRGRPLIFNSLSD